MLRELGSIAPEQTHRLIGAYMLTVVGVALQGVILALLIIGLSALVNAGEVPRLLFAGVIVALVLSIAALRRSDSIRATQTRRAAHAVVECTTRHATQLPLGWFSSVNRDRLSQVAGGIQSMEWALRWMYANLATAFTYTVVAVVLLAVFVHPLAALIVVVTSAATLTVAAFALGPMARMDAAYEVADDEATARIIEYAQAQPVLRAFAGTREAASAVLDAYTTLDGIRRRGVQIRSSATGLLPAFFAVAALIGTVIVGVFTGASVYSVVIALIATALQSSSLAIVGRVWNWIGAGRIIVAEARSILDTPPLPEPSLPQALPAGGLSVEFRDVTFGYREGEPVVKGVSFTVPPASTLALVGPSGAGKSTVLRLAARFWDVTDGAVLVGGVDVREVANRELMEAFAVVFQDVYLFEGTLRENVLLARPSATEAEFADAAARANLTEVIENLPDGWDTQVGERGVALSGGQRQRVSIARALLKQASIVLLDEPTAALDAENQHLLNEAIRELGRDRTVIMITHQLSSAAHADRIVFLKDGGVAETGTHAELLAADGAYAAYWHRQHAPA